LIRYSCDWCKREKRPGEQWVMGLAAEKIGPAGRRRQYIGLRQWSERLASDPLAVHFCSEEHKNLYVARLIASSKSGRRALPRNVEPTKVQPQAATAPAIVVTKPRASAKLEQSRRPAAKKPGRKPIAFTPEDRMRAHGLGVRLDTE
jgi:hypothetical protein